MKKIWEARDGREISQTMYQAGEHVGCACEWEPHAHNAANQIMRQTSAYSPTRDGNGKDYCTICSHWHAAGAYPYGSTQPEAKASYWRAHSKDRHGGQKLPGLTDAADYAGRTFTEAKTLGGGYSAGGKIDVSYTDVGNRYTAPFAQQGITGREGVTAILNEIYRSEDSLKSAGEWLTTVTTEISALVRRMKE